MTSRWSHVCHIQFNRRTDGHTQDTGTREALAIVGYQLRVLSHTSDQIYDTANIVTLAVSMDFARWKMNHYDDFTG